MDTKLKFPKYIEIQTQSLCNANCSICPYESVSKLRGANRSVRMSSELIKRIIDESELHKDEVDRIIPYMNNEPFLDNRMIDILRYIKEKGFFVELSTNASTLSEVLSEQIIKKRLIDDFRISFFSGYEEIYRKMMPGLNYQRTLHNIQYFLKVNKENGNPVPVQIIQVMHEKMDLKGEKRKMEELFPEVNIHYFGYLDRAGNMKCKNDLAIKDFSDTSLRGCSLSRIEERFTITAHGEVIICSQDWLNKEVIGNITKDSIKEIFLGKGRVRLIEQVYGERDSDDSFLCKRCKLANVQNIWSGVISQNFKGDKFMSPSDEKILL